LCTQVFKVVKEGGVIPVHAMKACRGSGCVDVLICDIGTR